MNASVKAAVQVDPSWKDECKKLQKELARVAALVASNSASVEEESRKTASRRNERHTSGEPHYTRMDEMAHAAAAFIPPINLPPPSMQWRPNTMQMGRGRGQGMAPGLSGNTPVAPPGPYACFNCGESSHFRRECPYPSNYSGAAAPQWRSFNSAAPSGNWRGTAPRAAVPVPDPAGSKGRPQ